MKKMFESATIECNDDGTYNVRLILPEKKETGKDADEICLRSMHKTMTASSLDEAVEKIKAMTNGNAKNQGKVLSNYFNGGEDATEEESK